MELLDGKKYKAELLERYKNIIASEDLSMRLDIILVGNDPASEVYVRQKVNACNTIGVKSVVHRLDENTNTKEVVTLIEELNENEEVTGIILQSPTPKSVDFGTCAELISPMKDVDGFTTINISQLYHGNETLIPCTVKGIIRLLEHYDVSIEGKNITIVGRGDIVGKPLALALNNRNATVTLCHSKTKDLSVHTSSADIVIVAVGKESLITGDMIKDGAIVVDAGMNRNKEGKLCGDCEFSSVSTKAALITPVPGGVGPMTVAMIVDNLIEADRMQKRIDIQNQAKL